jgi:hypothetical protein
MSAPTAKRAPDALGYVVAQGRTVYVGNKALGPGEPVEFPKDEIEHLLAAGFVARTDAEAPIGAGVQVGGLQIKGGRRPGGVVV